MANTISSQWKCFLLLFLPLLFFFFAWRLSLSSSSANVMQSELWQLAFALQLSAHTHTLTFVHWKSTTLHCFLLLFPPKTSLEWRHRYRNSSTGSSSSSGLDWRATVFNKTLGGGCGKSTSAHCCCKLSHSLWDTHTHTHTHTVCGYLCFNCFAHCLSAPQILDVTSLVGFVHAMTFTVCLLKSSFPGLAIATLVEGAHIHSHAHIVTQTPIVQLQYFCLSTYVV